MQRYGGYSNSRTVLYTFPDRLMAIGKASRLRIRTYMPCNMAISTALYGDRGQYP